MEQRICRHHRRGRPVTAERLLFIAKSTKGLSLIELIVAITLMGIGFLGVVTLFPLGNRTVSESGLQTTAVELAQQGLENLLDLDYNDQKLSTAETHTDSTTVGARMYSMRWTVTRDVPIAGCKTVVYTVSWDEQDESRQISVTGVIASSGRS